MKIAIRYYTKTGNTKKLAEAISDAINVESMTIDTPLSEDVDILFLGSAVYAAGIDKKIPGRWGLYEKRSANYKIGTFY